VLASLRAKSDPKAPFRWLPIDSSSGNNTSPWSSVPRACHKSSCHPMGNRRCQPARSQMDLLLEVDPV
jgi:hypothetical protein